MLNSGKIQFFIAKYLARGCIFGELNIDLAPRFLEGCEAESAEDKEGGEDGEKDEAGEEAVGGEEEGVDKAGF